MWLAQSLDAVGIRRPGEFHLVGECDQLVWVVVSRSLRFFTHLPPGHLQFWTLPGHACLHLFWDLASLAPELSSFGLPTLPSGRSRSASLFTACGVPI